MDSAMHFCGDRPGGGEASVAYNCCSRSSPLLRIERGPEENGSGDEAYHRETYSRLVSFGEEIHRL